MNAVPLSPQGPRRYSRRAIVPDAVMGMIFFVACEVMFFAALISAMFVVRGSAREWPPIDQPRLPVLTTAGNTLVLLASGVMLWMAGRALRKAAAPTVTARFLRWSMWLGTVFVTVQGMEWMRLIRYGLTMQSCNYGSFFYLIIGMHALHAVIALALLAHVHHTFAKGTLRLPRFWAAQVFWYFVVGLWPFLYVLVYLS
jgi:heme/copper-type cytochrome/quinol oxidase subunit 3